MVQVLDTVTLTAPATDPNIDEGQTFTFTISATWAGHGGINDTDFHFEFSATSSTGPWTDIPSSGSELTCPSPNPILAQTTSPQSKTVTGAGAGTYWVRARCVEGATDLNDGPQEVTVNDVAATTPKTLDATAVAVPTVTRKVFKNLAATAVAVPVATKKTSVAFAVTALAAASLATKAVLPLALIVTTVASVSLIRKTGKMIGATAVASPAITRTTSKILTAVALSVPSQIRKSAKQLNVTAVAQVSVTTMYIAMVALAAMAVGVASVVTSFIPGGGGGPIPKFLRNVFRNVFRDPIRDPMRDGADDD